MEALAARRQVEDVAEEARALPAAVVGQGQRRAQERARNPHRHGNVRQRERERRGKAEQPEDQWRVAAICREGSGQLAKGARERRRHADAQAAHSVVEALEGKRVAHGNGDEGRNARGDSERVIRSEIEEHVGS